jgi:hypothetical protein
MKSPRIATRMQTRQGCAPARDLCPVLRSIRIRITVRVGAVDNAILGYPTPIARGDEGLAALQLERAALMHALELIAAASERGIAREVRRLWLETLLGATPDCVTAKARGRLRLLIEGLCDG